MRKTLVLFLSVILLLSAFSAVPVFSACAEDAFEEYCIESNGMRIYGRLYIPEGAEGPCPAVILSHGFGGTWEDSSLYIPRFLACGVSCYVFDFPGGAAKNQSDGSFTDMSVMTEKEHLLNIIDNISAHPMVSSLMLAGFSQGGVVTGLAAAERADKILGEILFYPALCISDMGHEAYGSVENIPEDPKAFWQTVGRRYYADVWDMDLTASVTAYEDQVLMFHGTNDPAVHHSYSVRACELFKHSNLILLSRGTHGFSEKTVNRIFPNIITFMEQIGLI